jgi:hypothetical protein
MQVTTIRHTDSGVSARRSFGPFAREVGRDQQMSLDELYLSWFRLRMAIRSGTFTTQTSRMIGLDWMQPHSAGHSGRLGLNPFVEDGGSQ